MSKMAKAAAVCALMAMALCTAASARGFVHVLIPRFTQFRKPITAPERWHITDIYRALAENRPRNELIARDAAGALSDGRTPLVLTERVDHAHRLAEMIGRDVEDARVFVLTGQGTAREKAAVLAELRSVGSDEKMIVVATGRYIGEGFDAPRLDTLMIASPRIAAGTTNALREKILLARTNGAVATVITRASDKTSALIDALQNMGARVIEREDLTKRFAVIDRRIVWYGGIDLLGRARADESVMRLENEEIAIELSGMT